MGLKLRCSWRQRLQRLRLKSDQCGIETVALQAHIAQRYAGSNRTNVGLKPAAARALAQAARRLKSDQCGIETASAAERHAATPSELKSDQCGIETAAVRMRTAA